MHNRFTSRKALPLLLLFAMLIVSVAVILPMVVSADAAEIQDFSYQTLTDLDIKNDDDTDLRFVFTIGDLDSYDEVGVIVSKSVATPTYDAANCFTYKTTTVYSKITVDGTPEPAPDGRWWVAVQLTGIPHSYFDSSLYLRAFAKKKNQDLVYSNPASFTVCSAGGHTHTVPNPTSGTATLVTAGTAIGHCNGCNLDNVTQYNARVKIAPTVLRFKNGSSDAEKFDENRLVKNALASGQKYYPDTENGNEGRDFYFQFDMLWNETMANCEERFQLCFYNDTHSKWNSFFYFFPVVLEDPQNNIDCLWAGGFDWTMGKNTLEGPAGGHHATFDKFPNLNSESGSMDYGWHRIGVRIHQEAKIENEKAVYSGVSYLYIDGVLRWKVDLNTATMESKGILLFKRSDAGVYSANNNSVYFDFWSDNIDQVSNTVYMVTANPVYKAVKPSEFKNEMTVMPDPDPEEATYILPDGTEVSAKVYFRDSEIYDSKDPSGPYKKDKNFWMYETVEEIRGKNSFAPTAEDPDGNDLWFEYSFLWNDTLSNRDTNLAEVRLFGFRNTNAYRGFYYLYLLNDDSQGGSFNTSNDCPYAGHIDYSTYKSDALEENNAIDLTSEGNTLNGKPIGKYTAGWSVSRDGSPYLWDSEYQPVGGWHRLGFRYHQEVESVEGSTVTYVGYTELYIDGVKVWKVLTAMQGFSYKENGVTKYKSLKENNLLLWTATAEEGVITGYTNNDTLKVGMRFDSVTDSTNNVFIAVSDACWTCGNGFARPVTRINTPTFAKYILPDRTEPSGTEISAQYYFKFN